MNEREGFRSQKTLNLYIVFSYKKSEDPRRFVLRRKALETFARAPSGGLQLSKRKNYKPLIFF